MTAAVIVTVAVLALAAVLIGPSLIHAHRRAAELPEDTAEFFRVVGDPEPTRSEQEARLRLTASMYAPAILAAAAARAARGRRPPLELMPRPQPAPDRRPR